MICWTLLAEHISTERILFRLKGSRKCVVRDEHPGMLKALLDRNYALGINRLFYHVYVHNPWLDRKPGMTLDGIGLFFQRDQTWWKKGAKGFLGICHPLPVVVAIWASGNRHRSLYRRRDAKAFDIAGTFSSFFTGNLRYRASGKRT